jgi:nucleoside 2-deoxyribosyltransferase
VKVFLAAPLTQTLGPDGRVDPGFRADLSRLHELLQRLGYDVFSAHVREKWGEALDTPSGALAIDLAQLQSCDVIVALLGTPLSPGVQFELGYAVAYKKPLLIIASAEGDVPYLIRGLPDYATACIHRTDDAEAARRFLETALRRSDHGGKDQKRPRPRSKSRIGRTRRGGAS